MAGFLYYVAGKTPGISDKEIRFDLGLDYAFDDGVVPTKAEVYGGPDGNNGIVIADGARFPGRIGFYPDDQTWTKIPKSSVWVGHYTGAEQPAPANLQRKTMLDGVQVVLADGGAWLAPIATSYEDSPGAPMSPVHYLPTANRLNEDGDWESGEILPRYRPLFRDAMICWTAFMEAAQAEIENAIETGEATVTFHVADQAAVAATAIGANYVVGPAECSLLGLFTDLNTNQVIAILIDWASFEEICSKKNFPGDDPLSMPAGHADTILGTSQPSPI